MSVLSEIREDQLVDGALDKLSLPELGSCPHYILVVQDCGSRRAVPVTCSDPLCVPCSKIRAAQVRARWEPVLKRMRAPRMITLTMQSGFDLRQVIGEFKTSFRRLLDLRLGKRGLGVLLDAALDFVCNPPADLPEQKRQEVLAKSPLWQKRITMFRSTCERKQATLGRSPRMRDVIGPGFASYEVTYNDDNGWHFHRHCTTDGAFIPWPVLVAAWKIATEGKGQIVDIRAVDKSPKSLKELIKYVTKAWELPDERGHELRMAVFGMKRVWPLGGAKPADVKKPCPFCGSVHCRPRPISGDFATLSRGTLADGTKWLVIGDGTQSVGLVLHDHVWVEAASLDLILSGFACQSQGP